jgi:Arc/MetJ family transcription regulator
MRTNIDIDEDLLKQAMAATETTTKKGAVEACLREVVQLRRQGSIRELRGKVVWRGHDDDWFASDEEILEKRRQAEEHRESAKEQMPAVERQPVLSGEFR